MLIINKPQTAIFYCPVFDISTNDLVPQPSSYPEIIIRRWDDTLKISNVIHSAIMEEDYPGNYVYEWDTNLIEEGIYQIEYIAMINAEEYKGFDSILIKTEETEDVALGSFINDSKNYYVNETKTFVFRASSGLGDLKIKILDVETDTTLIYENMSESVEAPSYYSYTYTPNKLTSLLIEAKSQSTGANDNILIHIIPNPKDIVQKIQNI